MGSEMHEMSIAISLLEQVQRVAQDNGATRVAHVEVSAGALQLVVDDALQMAWQAASEGTVAAGSTLNIVHEAARVVCRQCGTQFAPDISRSFACPECGEADSEVVAGNDIVLTAVTADIPERTGNA